MARKAPPAPVSLVDAVAVSRLDGLRKLRDVLAAAALTAEAGPLAALARQLRDTLADIDALERQQPTRGSVLDEIAARRATRHPTPPARGSAAVGGDKRAGRR